MKSAVVLTTVMIWLLLHFCAPSNGWAQYDYIDISNPFLRKIPLAIPEMVNLPGSEAPDEILTQTTQMLIKALEFT